MEMTIERWYNKFKTCVYYNHSGKLIYIQIIHPKQKRYYSPLNLLLLLHTCHKGFKLLKDSVCAQSTFLRQKIAPPPSLLSATALHRLIDVREKYTKCEVNGFIYNGVQYILYTLEKSKTFFHTLGTWERFYGILTCCGRTYLITSFKTEVLTCRTQHFCSLNAADSIQYFVPSCCVAA